MHLVACVWGGATPQGPDNHNSQDNHNSGADNRTTTIGKPTTGELRLSGAFFQIATRTLKKYFPFKLLLEAGFDPSNTAARMQVFFRSPFRVP